MPEVGTTKDENPVFIETNFPSGPLKNGFAAAHKSFSLLLGLHIIVIDCRMLSSITERRKTFDSLLANHFSAVMQSSLIKISKNRTVPIFLFFCRHERFTSLQV